MIIDQNGIGFCQAGFSAGDENSTCRLTAVFVNLVREMEGVRAKLSAVALVVLLTGELDSTCLISCPMHMQGILELEFRGAWS